MAKETITRLVDDLDGGVAHETVKFSLDGHEYEIDLSTKNAKQLRRELAPFVDRGTRVTAGRASTGPGRQNRGPRTRTNELLQIRAWAQAKGYEVAERGRIKNEIVEAFHQANGR